MRVNIFSRSAGNQQYGIGVDAQIITQTLREISATSKNKLEIQHKDPYNFIGNGKMPEPVDVNIFLEVPCRSAFPWAKVNVVIPNPDWWYNDAWKWVFDEPSTVLFHRSKFSEGLFQNFKRNFQISWRPQNFEVKNRNETTKVDQALYIVGGSMNKLAACKIVVDAWKPEYPPLVIVASERNYVVDKPNVQWITQYISPEQKLSLQQKSKYHVVASLAEGFGYTMCEAIQHGAIPLWTNLEVYNEFWGDFLTMGKIPVSVNAESRSLMIDKPRSMTSVDVAVAMDTLLTEVKGFDILQYYSRSKEHLVNMTRGFRTLFGDAWKSVERLVNKAAPLIAPPRVLDNVPVLGVVTLVHNRPNWFTNAARNLMISEYPKDKMVWVIVDDGVMEGRVDSKIDAAKRVLNGMNIKYISMSKKTPISDKRNQGCAAAISARPDLQVFAFMDDDDHYPAPSLTIRSMWLAASKKGCVYASVLPMYHIPKYISAVNVPPLDLAPCQRLSEASLCFTRNFWEARGFPSSVNVAEGEAFLKDREQDSIEIPPEGVIVSFLHNRNSTSRRVPKDQEANGCHYGFSDDYFTMICHLGGAVE